MPQDKPLLAEVEDDKEDGFLERLREKHFPAGAPILYKENEDDTHYILEHPDGKKQRLTPEELDDFNASET